MQIYFPNNQTWRLPKRINGIIPYDRQDIMHLWHGKIVLVLQRKRKDICPARQYNRLVHHQITMSFQKPWIQIMYRRENVGTTFLNSVSLNSHVFLCVPSRVCIVGCFGFFFLLKLSNIACKKGRVLYIPWDLIIVSRKMDEKDIRDGLFLWLWLIFLLSFHSSRQGSGSRTSPDVCWASEVCIGVCLLICTEMCKA